MKKLSLILATLMMLTVFVSSFGINFSAKGPLDAFTEVAPVPEENQINSTTWNHSVGVRQLENPVGAWSWAANFDGKEGCWGMNRQTQYFDCDLKTIIVEYKDVDYSDKGATSVKELVFADGYTQSGLGDFGRIRATMEEVFNEMTVVYSNDGENWTEVEFTVAYHTEEGSFTTETGNAVPYDTFWHLIFAEEVPAAKYFALHTTEAKAWDADDHSPKLAILLDWKRLYLVKSGEGSSDAPATDAPVTDAPVTDAPVTDAPATDAPATDAPATDAPATDDAQADAENDMTWLYIVIAAAAVVVVVVVIVVAKKKK